MYDFYCCVVLCCVVLCCVVLCCVVLCCVVLCCVVLSYVIIYIPIRGKPTKLAPIPNPAPDRADTPIAGTYVSNTEKVAAAVK